MSANFPDYIKSNTCVTHSYMRGDDDEQQGAEKMKKKKSKLNKENQIFIHVCRCTTWLCVVCISSLTEFTSHFIYYWFVI